MSETEPRTKSRYLSQAELQPFVGLHVAISRGAPGRSGSVHGKLVEVRAHKDAYVPIGGSMQTERGLTSVDLSEVTLIRALGTTFATPSEP